MKAVLNGNASGSWSAREGEEVEVVGAAPNGLATAVICAGGKGPVYLPTRWLDVEPERCPTCGHIIED